MFNKTVVTTVIILMFLSFSALFLVANINSAHARDLNANELRRCISLDGRMTDLLDDIRSAERRYRENVNRANRGATGAARDHYVNTARTLANTVREKENIRNNLVPEFNRMCANPTITHEVYIKECDREYKLREGFCSTFPELADRVRKENDW